jgi:nicotinate-nucleotide pyrophosphorylase (carboxylating)
MEMNWNSRRISAILSNALLEDQATRDATTLATIEPHQRASATILAKEDCVLAGIGSMQRVFELFAELEGESQGYPEVSISIPKEVFDGVPLHKGQFVATIWHNARALLSCERLILNLLQRLSGIATITAKFANAIEGTGAAILDTRKTAPGLRLLEKYAVRCGGGFNHRLDLSDGILVKNNHIDIAGGVRVAVERALANRKGEQTVEVEVRNLQELDDALKYGAESILLDNMTLAQTREAVARVRREARDMSIESSGGITLENVRQYAETGVQYISVGALTHSVRAVDLSMRMHPA